MVPLVMLSHHNVTGAASMKPGRHLAFLTPSKAFRKLVGMEFFHVAIRGVAHEATERETARYLGQYNVHHPKRSLSYEEYQMLPADVSISARLLQLHITYGRVASPTCDELCASHGR